MNRNIQFPTMPCYCVNQPRSRSVPRSDTSDIEELKQGFPRSDYSGRSSQKYESGSALDDQAWNALSSLRQKACRFITETEQPQTDSLATQYAGDRGFRYGGANVLRKANDLIDYAPQSEFLKRMKQQCQLLCNSQDNIFSVLNEGFINDTNDYQMSIRSQSMGEYPQGNTLGQNGVRFDDLLYQNPSYDPPCSADEKLLDTLIDRKIPSEQGMGRPKSANKKSQHISRSKKPSKCRGRRKRKSGSSEKCESEDQFEPNLKKPHENSCERCWRYASPARSPVNKPDQKYDPNFRRGHSCYDFERGDGEFYDIRKSPCKNLQPITSREKQEPQPQQQQQSPPPKVLEARPLSGTWKRSPDDQPRSRGPQRSPDAQTRAASPVWQQSPEAQPQTYSSTRQRPPDIQPQTFTTTWQQPVEPRPQTYTSEWRRSPEAQPLPFPSTRARRPEAQPQAFNATWPRCPEPQPQTFNNTWPGYPEAQPQTFVSKWPRSPEPQPQTFKNTWPRCPEPQPQTFNNTWPRYPEAQPQTFNNTWPRYPEAQPQTFTSKWPRSPEPQPRQSPQERTQVQFRDQSPLSPKGKDYRYQPMKSPERSVPIPQSFTHPSQLPVSQGVLYPESVQVPAPDHCIPGDFYSAEMRYSDGIEDLDTTDYRTICPGPREEFHEPTNASLSARSFGSRNQSPVGENVYSPRHPSPPRSGPNSLGTIPEAADSESCKCKLSQQNRSGSPQTVKAESSKSQTKQFDLTGQSNAKPSPKKTSKSPNKSTKRSSPNKSTSKSLPNKSTSRSSPNRSTRRSSPNKTPIGSSPNKSSSGSSRSKSRARIGVSPNKISKSPNRSGNGSTKKCRPKSASPKPVGSKPETKSPKKSPPKSPKAEAKKNKSLDDVSVRRSRTPEQRPQSSDPRRETSFRRDQVLASVRVEPPDQYLGLDHGIEKCVCGPESSFLRGVKPDKYTVCCHCPGLSKSSPRATESKRFSPQPNAELNSRQFTKSSLSNSPRGNQPSENQTQTYKGYDGRIFECPHRKGTNLSAEQPLSNNVNSSLGRDYRLLSEQQNTPVQNISQMQGSPRKYFMFYMTKCKENREDEDVEVLVEELTQACPIKTDSRTKDLKDKMKKIMECPSDSLALRFQKGVSDQCKIPQSSRVLYF